MPLRGVPSYTSAGYQVSGNIKSTGTDAVYPKGFPPAFSILNYAEGQCTEPETLPAQAGILMIVEPGGNMA
jgi:hypothetical protein